MIHYSINLLMTISKRIHLMRKEMNYSKSKIIVLNHFLNYSKSKNQFNNEHEYMKKCIFIIQQQTLRMTNSLTLLFSIKWFHCVNILVLIFEVSSWYISQFILKWKPFHNSYFRWFISNERKKNFQIYVLLFKKYYFTSNNISQEDLFYT